MLATLLCRVHPFCQIIIPSAVTKEMHTPSITMHRFSVRGFGQFLIKNPFHSFSWEIIVLSSHQDATSIDPFSSYRKPLGRLNSRVFNHLNWRQQSIIKDVLCKGKKRVLELKKISTEIQLYWTEHMESFFKLTVNVLVWSAIYQCIAF